MLIAARLLPATVKFLRQIVPPVIATLVAAVLIAGYNKTFSGHLTQPRMSALHAAEANVAAPGTPVVPVAVPTAAKASGPVTEVITIYEYMDAPERLAEKDAGQEAGKDQAAIKMAADPAPPRHPTPEPVLQRAAAALERTALPAPRPEPRHVASVEHLQPAPAPVIAAPPVIVAAPVGPPATAPIAQEPPPVITATPSMVTVPDKPGMRPLEAEAQAEPPAPREGPIGMIVNTLKPSNWFARARTFGEKIEQAGNDILPNIRQQ